MNNICVFKSILCLDCLLTLLFYKEAGSKSCRIYFKGILPIELFFCKQWEPCIQPPKRKLGLMCGFFLE